MRAKRTDNQATGPDSFLPLRELVGVDERYRASCNLDMKGAYVILVLISQKENGLASGGIVILSAANPIAGQGK